MKDFYKILGVSPASSAEEIKKKYRKLAIEFHPDKNQQPGAEDRFKEVNEAYSVLGDPEKKIEYDHFFIAGLYYYYYHHSCYYY